MTRIIDVSEVFGREDAVVVRVAVYVDIRCEIPVRSRLRRQCRGGEYDQAQGQG